MNEENFDRIPFENLEADLLLLEEILGSLQQAIKPGSKMETIILNATNLVEEYKRLREPDDHLDIRPIYRNLIGLHDITDKLKRVKDHPNFPQLKKHLRLFQESVIPQNLQSSVTDGGANKIFELYLALAVMRISRDVNLDDPEQSKGDNPDILFTDGGHTFGIACKVLHSNSGKTLLDNCTKALDQIERSAANIGLIVVSLKNVIDHDEFWPISNLPEYQKGAEPEYAAYRTLQGAAKKLDTYGTKYHDYILKSIEYKDLQSMFLGKKTPPDIYLFLNTTCMRVIGAEAPVTNIKHLFRLSISTTAESAVSRQMAEKLNHYIQFNVN